MEGFHDHRPPEQLPCRRPDHNLVVRRCLLQPGRRPYHGPRNGIAERGPGPCDHDVARFDARPRPVDDALDPRRAAVQRQTCSLCVGNGPHGPQRVVLPCHREPEERDQGVPELALDAPTVPLDHLGRDPRAVGPEAPDGLSIRVGVRAGGDVEGRDRRGASLPGKPGPRRAQGPCAGAVCRRQLE
jgi:hypothetical protein